MSLLRDNLWQHLYITWYASQQLHITSWNITTSLDKYAYIMPCNSTLYVHVEQCLNRFQLYLISRLVYLCGQKVSYKRRSYQASCFDMRKWCEKDLKKLKPSVTYMDETPHYHNIGNKWNSYHYVMIHMIDQIMNIFCSGPLKYY